MSKYWSKAIKNIETYVPGEQPKGEKYIKLNTNENPYPPSPAVTEALKSAANESLRLYPDPTCDILRETIAEYFKFDKNQIFAGNGSDEILALAWKAFFEPGKPVKFADITYSFYPVYCKINAIDFETVMLNDDYTMPVEPFFNSKGGVVIANPNAPTGSCLPLDSIEAIIKNNPGTAVIIDEAYIDFGGKSAAELIESYDNLLVVQTLSKARSLAGLRVGYAMGNKDLIGGLEKARDSFNSYTLDALALAGAAAAFEDEEYFIVTRNNIIRTREKFTEGLRKLGFDVVESKANFVFAGNKNVPAVKIFNVLRNNGILVRHFDKPRISDYLRISIGTPEQMEETLRVLKKLTQIQQGHEQSNIAGRSHV